MPRRTIADLVRSIEAMILGHTSGAGIDSSNAGAIGNAQAGDRNTSAFLLRGLTSSVSLRNSFMPGGGLGVGISSILDVERVEIINGPQSLLYGLGGAGGVINTVTKRAVFDRALRGSIFSSIDGFGNPGTQIEFGRGGKHFAYVASLKRDIAAKAPKSPSSRAREAEQLQREFGRKAHTRAERIIEAADIKRRLTARGFL